MSSYDEDEEGDINPSNNPLYTLQREKEYINSLYTLKKVLSVDKNREKLFGVTKEKNFNVIITKISNISFRNNPISQKRLIITTQLIEENIVLIENLWIEETNQGLFNLYISEFTKSTYRNEYNLITLNHYLNENHTEKSYKNNIIILLQILQKLKDLHINKKFAHLNLCPNNIYFNKNNQNIYFGPPKIFQYLNNDFSSLWYSSPEECYIEKRIEEDLLLGIKNDIWSLGCILCEMFFIVSPLFQVFSKREKMKKVIEILGVPKIEEIDYMSNQEYSFIQSTEENSKNNNKLKDFLLPEQQEMNFTSINSYIKKIVFEIVYKCFLYNRTKRISIDEIINQIDYLYDRYIRDKPTKIDAMNVIDRDNLMQLNAPIIDIPLNKYKIKKNINNLATNDNSSGSYLLPFSGNINNNNNDFNRIGLNISKDDDNENNMNISSQNQKNYDSFISGKHSTVTGNNYNELDEKINSLNNNYNNNNNNNNKNFSKFCSLSSISSNRNYNKGYLTSITTNNGNNNHYNLSNATEKFTDGNNYNRNQDEESMYIPSELGQLNKNEDPEYSKLQNRKYILLNFIFLSL